MIMMTIIDSLVISSASVVYSVVGDILLLQNVRSWYVQDFRLDSKMPSAYYTDVYCPNVCERWRRHKYGHPIWQAIIFCSCGFFFFLFVAYSQQSQIGCLPYFHRWCGLSANLERMSEMCYTRLAEIQEAKITQKSPSAHYRTTLSGYIFATRA